MKIVKPVLDSTPDLSVIIPTHRRVESLTRCLRALARQNFAADRFEVIVADDGPTRDIDAVITAATTMRITLVPAHKYGRGAGAARNAAARHARGQLLVFLDDDMIPTRRFVSAHWRFHLQNPNAVAVGDVRSVIGGSISHSLRDELRERRRMHGRSLGPADLLTGNCSIPRALFEQLGGFANGLMRHEDYELGCRITHDGIPIVYIADARAVELHTRAADLFLENAYLRGEAAARILQTNRDGGRHFDLPRYFRGSAFTRFGRGCVWRAVQLPGIRRPLRKLLQSTWWGPIGLRVPTVARVLGAANYWSGVATVFDRPADLKRAALPGADHEV